MVMAAVEQKSKGMLSPKEQEDYIAWIMFLSLAAPALAQTRDSSLMVCRRRA